MQVYNLKLSFSKLTDDFDEAVRKIHEFEAEIQKLRKENFELKKYISFLMEKH